MLNKEKCQDRVFGTILGDIGYHCINPERKGFKPDCTNCLCYSFSKAVNIDKFFKNRKVNKK